MKVLIVGNYQHDDQQSMQRYAELLTAELQLRGHDIQLLRPQPILGRLKPGGTGLGKWLGYIDKFILFPFALWRATYGRPERVVHICDHSNAMYTSYLQNRPHVVTCHDLLAVRSALGHFPQNRTGWSGRLLQAWILRGLRQAQRIVCVSEETRRQLMALPRFATASITVVANGLNYPYHPLSESESRRRFIARREIAPFVDRPFIFFIGGTQWYKNRPGVLRIFLHYAAKHPQGAQLLFAGKSFTAQDQTLLDKAGPVLRARIHHVGSPDNETLNALYSRARCLLFPSLEEGFGWPLIEAMSAGCPVLTNNRPPMNEIGGSVAAYLDPTDEAGAVQALATLLAEPAFVRALRVSAGLQRAARFSAKIMVDEIINEYRRALQSFSHEHGNN